MNELPEFEKRPRARVMPLMRDVFGLNMVSLEEFPDGHYRVTFRRGVFTLTDEAEEPSRSQWTTLKKRLKRRDHRVFVFRDHGKVPCAAAGDECYYLDFGFFRYD